MKLDTKQQMKILVGIIRLNLMFLTLLIVDYRIYLNKE